MDLSTLTNRSPQVLKVLSSLKDPEFLTAFKENPEAALKSIDVELEPQELDALHKIESYREMGGEMLGFLGKIKTFLGYK